MDRVPPRSVLDLRDSANPSGPACTVGEYCRSSTAFQSRLAVTVHGPERFLGRICSYGACPVMAGRTLPPQLERLYSNVGDSAHKLQDAARGCKLARHEGCRRQHYGGVVMPGLTFVRDGRHTEPRDPAGQRNWPKERWALRRR